jgi:hypothetical protein
MSASTLTTVAFIYKRLYSDKDVANIAMRDHVWWAKIAKEGGFVGESFLYPIRYGNPQGISSTFANAQTNAKSSKGVQMRAYRKMQYGVITLDGEAIAAAKGNKGAFMDLVTMETDRVLEEMGDTLAFNFHRDKDQLLGRGASAAGNVITLTIANDARNFKVGMTVRSDNTSTGASPNTGTTFVTAVDEDAGTVTFDDTSDITGFAATDYFFRDGSTGQVGMEGLENLTPLAAPTSGESFREVDRSVDARRLAGSRLDDTSLPVEVALMQLAVKISNVGRSHAVDEAYINPTHFFNMTQRLNAKVEYQDGGGTANVGFQYVTLHTAAGSIRVYADPDAPMNRGRASREGSMYVKHLDGLPHIISDDGNMSIREASADGIETRAVARCNLIQTDPSAQGVCSLATS